MNQKYYTIAFQDKTQNGAFSSTQIETGAESINKQNKSTEEIIAGQVGNKLFGSTVSSASSALGFNLSPVVSLGKAFMTGAGGGAVASAGMAVANQIITLVWQTILNKMNKLEQESIEAN